MAEKLPAELLAAVLAEGLVLPLEAVLAAGTNRKRGVPALEKGRFAIVDHRHGDAVGELLTGRENAQQFVGRSVQADADLLQRVDRGSGLAAGDGAEISGAEVAEFGGGFIGKLLAVAYTAPRVQYDRRRWCTGSARMVYPFR